MRTRKLKFIVILYRKQGTSHEQFRQYFRDAHRSLAEKLPGLLKYKYNFKIDTPNRPPVAWDAIVELFFENIETMEAAWRSREGNAATEDLVQFVDLSNSSWSVVEEEIILG